MPESQVSKGLIPVQKLNSHCMCVCEPGQETEAQQFL